ncbi:tetratricopeptide repeat protein [Methanophagales archaeon]|nr:MAG: tetratricopeptide repeat protein [Methanophagales archaeon]
MQSVKRKMVKNEPELSREEIREGGIGLAAKLVLDGNYGDARRALKKILKIYPDDTELMTLISATYLMEAKFKEAKRWLNKVFSIDPDYPKALYNLGVIHSEREKWEEAVEAYERAIEHYPSSAKNEIADAYQNLGCALWETGRKNEALDTWKTCLKYNPKQEYAKRNLKEFTNEYGLPKSPMPGMNDLWAFVDMKQNEYLAREGKENFEDIDEVTEVMGKIKAAWNERIAPRYGRRLDLMSTKEKIKLFKGTKVF